MILCQRDWLGRSFGRRVDRLDALEIHRDAEDDFAHCAFYPAEVVADDAHIAELDLKYAREPGRVVQK